MEKEEKLEINQRRLHMAFNRLMKVFDELGEAGVTEAELVLATQFAFEARILLVFTKDLLSSLDKLEQEEVGTYAS